MNPDSNLLNNYRERKKKKFSFVWMFFILITILIVGFGGYLIYESMFKTKTSAQIYLIDSSSKLKKVAEKINELKTEEFISIETVGSKRFSLILKKVEVEINNTKEAIKAIEEAKKQTEQPVNQKIEDINILTKQFLKNTKQELETYLKYYEYSYNIYEKYFEYLKKAENSIEALSKDSLYAITPEKKDIEIIYQETQNFLEFYKNQTPPEGLEDYQKEFIAWNEEIIKLSKTYLDNLEKGEKGKQKMEKLKEFVQNTAKIKEIKDIENLYFESMHERFEQNRQKLYKIKTLFNEKNAMYDAEISTIDIESW